MKISANATLVQLICHHSSEHFYKRDLPFLRYAFPPIVTSSPSSFDGTSEVKRHLLNNFDAAHLPFESDNIMPEIPDVMDQSAFDKTSKVQGRLIDNFDNIIESTVLDEPLHPNEILEFQSEFQSDR